MLVVSTGERSTREHVKGKEPSQREKGWLSIGTFQGRQWGKGQRRSFSLPVDQSRARPCGSTIRKKTISAPKIMNSRCDAVTTEIGMPSHLGTELRKSARRTMKAAPKKLPMMEPRPPMITMNSSWNERSIENAAGSH